MERREQIKYTTINFRVYKGEKEKILKYLNENHLTMNGFINKLVAEKIPDFEPMNTDLMRGWK